MVCKGVSPADDGGFGGAIKHCQFPDILCRYPRDFGRPFRRAGLNMDLELIESHRPLFNELSIIQLVVDNDVQHGQSQGPVRSRPERYPPIGFVSRLRTDRIDDNELGPPRPGVGNRAEKVALAIGNVMAGPHRRPRITAPHYDKVGGPIVRLALETVDRFQGHIQRSRTEVG